MKKDIRKIKFKTIAGWRGDSHCCPQAFGGDVFAGCSMGCWWCFCREMEEGLYNRYYDGWSRDLVRPCDPDEYRRLFDRAFGSDKKTEDWNIQCLRQGLPFNMGSKAETFCLEDWQENVVVPVLEAFREYRVPVIFETKSHYIGLARYLDIIKDLNAAVIVAVSGGSDTLNYELEPGAPVSSMRWQLVERLNALGIWTAVRWEPILTGINSTQKDFETYAKRAKRYGAKHVSFFNYRTSNYKIAQQEFEARGYDFIKLCERNLDENWRPVGARFFDAMRTEGVRVSTPDYVNFPFESDCESCCGVDGLFPMYEFTYQHACRLIKERGSVCWDDMDAIEFREPKAYERIKKSWNGGGGYYSLADSPLIVALDFDSKGRAIYGRADDGAAQRPAEGLLF